jgi:hypothetical protein
MDPQPSDPVTAEAVRTYVEQLLRTGLLLTDLISTLVEELPEDACPGEDSAEVLIDMLSGTVQPVAAAAGTGTLTQATGLLGAVADRTVRDLKLALQLAARDGPA